MAEPFAVYVHIPFCPTKCGYCDFNSYAGTGEEEIERTVRAQILEIQRSEWYGRPAKTIFFGGGTPTFLDERQLVAIFEAVLSAHPPISGCEITSEANPGTVDATKFRAMRQAGFNRVSLGAQSFVDAELLSLGRIHKSGEIERAVDAARSAGFDNVNLDLMFALPDQSPYAWNRNLERALALKPEHLSLYCLTIEPNTAFYKRHLHNELNLPDEDHQVEMYEACVSRASEAGYEQYEISNFAKPGQECLHNLEYWHGNEYAGYGPGAVGCVEGPEGRVRYTNLKHPTRYIEAVEAGSPLPYEQELLTPENERMERIMLGLRLNAGLGTRGLTLETQSVNALKERGWIEVSESRIALTDEGRHFCSEVALALI